MQSREVTEKGGGKQSAGDTEAQRETGKGRHTERLRETETDGGSQAETHRETETQQREGEGDTENGPSGER